MIFARNALASGPGKALKLNRLYAYLAKSEGGHPLKERRKFSEILQGDLPSVALVPGPQPRHSGNVNPPSAIGGDSRQSRGGCPEEKLLGFGNKTPQVFDGRAGGSVRVGPGKHFGGDEAVVADFIQGVDDSGEI
jgi:hypothetical protein